MGPTCLEELQHLVFLFSPSGLERGPALHLIAFDFPKKLVRF